MFSRLLNQKLFIGTISRLSPSILIPIFSDRNENDYDELNSPHSPLPKTGWDRVKAMYSMNEQGENSVELHNVAQGTFFGLFIGACVGGTMKSRDAYLYFIENNQATIFKSPMQAKKQLQDAVTVGFAKGAYRFGWRLGVFTGLFSLISTTISVYRDQSAVSDYIVAGSLTGAMYKASLGPAAMLVGATVGGILSAIGGLLIIGIIKISGMDINNIRKGMHKLREMRQDQLNQAAEKSATEKNDDLTRHHDRIVEEKGVKSIQDIS